MTHIRSLSPLATLISGVAAAARLPLAARPAAVGAAIQAMVPEPDLLAGMDCPCGAEGYRRHLLHADPRGEFALVALVWRPGQMSPVHGHKTWCALAVHRGTLTETWYEPSADGLPVATATRLLRPGQGGHGPADPTLIHRLANLSCSTAVSIHCYGVGFERFGQDVNQVHAA